MEYIIDSYVNNNIEDFEYEKSYNEYIEESEYNSDYNDEYNDEHYDYSNGNYEQEKINDYNKNKFIYAYNKWHDHSITFIKKRQEENRKLNKNDNFLLKLDYNLLNMQGGSLHNNGTRTPRSEIYRNNGNIIWDNKKTNIGVYLEKENNLTPRNNRSHYINNIENKDIGNVMNFYINLNLNNDSINYIEKLVKLKKIINENNK